MGSPERWSTATRSDGASAVFLIVAGLLLFGTLGTLAAGQLTEMSDAEARAAGRGEVECHPNRLDASDIEQEREIQRCLADRADERNSGELRQWSLVIGGAATLLLCLFAAVARERRSEPHDISEALPK